MWFSALVILLVLVIFGAVVQRATLAHRTRIRQLIVNREGEILHGIARLEQLGADSASSLIRMVDDPAGQLALTLRLSRLNRDVVAVRLFDADGRFVVAIPASAKEANVPAEAQARLALLMPLSRFHPHAARSDLFLTPRADARASDTFSLLSVHIPLHADGQSNLLASAELIHDGHTIARELAEVDKQLVRQGAWTFAAAGSLAALILLWAFHRSAVLNRRIQLHAESLRRANQELTLAAKTSALGAVAAHVVHGLTSPLSGLQHFVASHPAEDAAREDAAKGAQRMQTLLAEVMRVLGEESGGIQYECPLRDLPLIVQQRVRAEADAARVSFLTECRADGMLSSRTANLVLLILENLVQNAVQACQPGATVRLQVTAARGGVRCAVIDQGSGLPADVQQGLFSPVRSRKTHGHGIGLAISQQLARHVGGEIQLVSTGTAGTVFALELPEGLLSGATADPQDPRYACNVNEGGNV
jgi:signal transduction histidine kinase